VTHPQRLVVSCVRDPVSGGWTVTLSPCGHETTMEDMGGIPIAARCPECPEEESHAPSG
jgi:hypothetical protein